MLTWVKGTEMVIGGSGEGEEVIRADTEWSRFPGTREPDGGDGKHVDEMELVGMECSLMVG